MRRPAVWFAVAGVLVLAIAYVAQGARTELPPASSPPLVPIPVGEPAAATQPDEPERVAELQAADLDRREVPAPVVAATAARLLVSVRGADRGEPVPGARVEVVANADLMRALEAAGTGIHAPAGRRLRAALAITGTTDERGVATVQVPAGGLLIEARRGERWGFQALAARPEDHRVEVRIGFDRDLNVQVLDQERRPRAGVPVAVRRQTDPEPRARFGFQVTETEPPDGVATFQHFQRRVQQGPGWHLTFAFPLRQPPVVPVDLDTPPQPPQQLPLPATGGLRILVRSPGGEVPDLAGVDVHVTALADGQPLWAAGPWAEPRLDRHSGEARVPWLGLGLEVQVELRRRGTVAAAATAHGPRRDGEVVDCEVRLDLPPVRNARGRFVHDDGRPWPAAKVDARVRLWPRPDEDGEPQPLRVDAGGRFTLEVRDARPPNGSRSYAFTAEHPDGSGLVTTTVRLDQEVPREGLDLGDVVLDHGPQLVAGRVVDANHRPVAGASFRLSAPAAVVERGAPAARTFERWRSVPTSGTQQTGEDGSFALFLPHGEPDPGASLVLTTQCDGYVPDLHRECLRGGSRTTVVLQPAGGLAGSFALGEGLTAGDLSVVLLEPAAPGREPSSRVHPVQVRDDGTFTVSELPAALLTLRVRRLGLDGFPEQQPAVVVEGLQVRPGMVERDPRIQQLRVEAAFATVRIQVVDRNSMPISNAVASVRGVAGSRTGVAGRDGVCRVRAARFPVDVEVVAFGYRSRLLPGVAGDTEVALDDGIAVKLHAGARPSGSDPDYRLAVRLHDVDAAGKRGGLTHGQALPWQPCYFGADGGLTLKLPAPGAYDCEVVVYVTGANHVVRGGAVLQRRITVGESREPQVFELEVPQAAVDAASREYARE